MNSGKKVRSTSQNKPWELDGGFSPVWPWASHLPSVWCSFFVCRIFKVKKRKCGFILLHLSLILLLTWKRQLKLPNQILSCYRSLPLAIYSFKEKKKNYFLATPHGMWDLGSLTRDQTHGPYKGSTVLTTGPPRKSPCCLPLDQKFLNETFMLNCPMCFLIFSSFLDTWPW